MDNQPAPAEPTDARVQAALKDYLERIDRGEPLDRETFFAQHPEIARELRSFIDAEEELRKLARNLRSEQETGDSTQSFSAHGLETIAPRAGGQRSGASEWSGLKQEFGRYRIVRQLGKGAMGAVYLAEDTQLERQVALKTPHFETQPTEELLERFYREARAAATLRHPNICPVYDVGQIEGTHYISMAYIEGNPLSAFVRTKPQPERQILLVVRKLAQALQEAHDHGIVHRDLKPANIMVDKRNEPVIMDFGLARQLQREKNIRLTQSGMLIGTPAYMSPEQIEGEPDKVGPLSDQYSLGVILYELLTGQLPFRGSLTAVMAQILTKETTRPSQLRPDLDQRIEAACLKMMAKDPAQRFASLSAVAEELAGILKNPAGKQVSKEPRGKGAGPGPAAEAAASASEDCQSAAKKSLIGAGTLVSLAAADVASLEELARKCLARHDYDQVIQIVERIPEEKRNAGLAQILEKARAKADEISFLIVEIDEAVRFNDRTTALRKADDLLKLKPGHHRALKVQEEFAGYGAGGAARIGLVRQFTQPWNEGGWIPWSVLAFGLGVFGVVAAVIVIWLRGGTALVIQADDPGIKIEMPGRETVVITAKGDKSVTVTPGDHTLAISYAGLETQTKSFSIKQGGTVKLHVWIADSSLHAVFFDGEKFDGQPGGEKAKLAGPGPGSKGEKESKETKADQAIALVKPGKVEAWRNTRPASPELVPGKLVAPFDEATAKASRQEWADYLKIPPEITNSIGMKFVLIPPGQFLMGSPDADSFAQDQERPQHPVTIRRPYYLGVHEVTRGQFAQFVRDTGYKTECERGNQKASGFDSNEDMQVMPNMSWQHPGYQQADSHPVVIVTWNDACAFCEWLNRKEGRSYRLPTEAEWEFAGRAGTTSHFIAGDRRNDMFVHGNGFDAMFREHFHLPVPKGDERPSDGYVFTAPVGSYRPNAFSLFDMEGNVWEWCRDWHAPFMSSSAIDPTGPLQGTHKVAKGGAFDCTFGPGGRDAVGPSDRAANLGFRIVCETAIRLDMAVPRAWTTGPNGVAKNEALSASSQGFVPLFNGRDLAGWKTHASQPGDWRVENGVLTSHGTGRNHLYTERGDFRDFHLRVEVRINAKGNSGIFGRASFGPRRPQNDPQWPWGYEAQLDIGGRDVNKTGSLYVGERGVVVSLKESPVAADEWFTEELIAEGNRIVVKVNGRTTADYVDGARRFDSGHIALQQHDPQTVVEFRKIEIRELALAAPAEAPKEADVAALTAPFDESTAQKAQQQWSDRLKTPVQFANSIKMRLQLIPSGRFRMGFSDGGSPAFLRPVHSVQITRPFYFGAYEVTRGEFAKFIAATRFKTKAERSKGGWHLMNTEGRIKWDPKHKFTWHAPDFPQRDDHPVVDICWDDAQAFCQWLSQKENKIYRLPTEAEWEYACRAGTTEKSYGGDDPEQLTKIGNIADATAKSKFPAWGSVKSSDGWLYTSPVGLFRPNNFGLYDTVGNAMEWCSDWYGSDYYKTSPEIDPPGTTPSQFHVARGGSFCATGDAVGRWHFKPDHHAPELGFRVVCEIPFDPSAPAAAAAVSPPGNPAAPVKRFTDRGAAEFVLSLGGTVTIRQGRHEQAVEPGDKALPSTSFQLVRVNLAKNARVTDAALEPLRGLGNILDLDLTMSAGITDAGLQSIEDLHTLEGLHLAGTAVGDAGLAHLERLTKLKSLTLGQTQVTDAGLAHLRGLTRLETLWLHETSVSDAGLEHLRGLTELRSLLLWSTKVTDAGLVHLEPLQRLEGLMLSGREVGDAGVAHLESLKQLKTLWLTETSLTDAGVAQLRGLPQLGELNLRGSRITDAGLSQLQTLKNLRKLNVSGTQVTTGEVEKLKHALPKCRINGGTNHS
jgi:formylglycine-generating enzyme required for sulfatase activity/predicted Ser/Thr protein kinase